MGSVAISRPRRYSVFFEVFRRCTKNRCLGDIGCNWLHPPHAESARSHRLYCTLAPHRRTLTHYFSFEINTSRRNCFYNKLRNRFSQQSPTTFTRSGLAARILRPGDILLESSLPPATTFAQDVTIHSALQQRCPGLREHAAVVHSGWRLRL